MVTAELAVALPILAVAVGFAATMLIAVGAQIRALDAAATAARLAARGEPAPAVRAAVDDIARGATLSVRTGDGDLVVARVSVRVPMLGLRGLPAFTVTVRAVAPAEAVPR